MTPFQATLLPASYRGVPFIVEENGGEAGRRGQVHEYWGRDTPYAEDGGKRARRIEVRAYVLGADCAEQRDALLAALEQKGPGLLVHPSMAPSLMQPDPQRPARWREIWDKNRRIEFDLAFVEPGQLLYPLAGADTQANSNTAADGIGAAADQDMADKTGAVASAGDSSPASPPGTPDAAAQAQQIQQSDAVTVAPPGLDDTSLESASQAGAGPGTLDTLAAHAALDTAPSPAQAAASGNATMQPPGSLPDIDSNAAALMMVPF